ncbi:MAG: lamin tail domain-containing protein [Spirochaetales bacterium]|nr:lamin tail domain-containing protein [Spirochaetales bacterium]
MRRNRISSYGASRLLSAVLVCVMILAVAKLSGEESAEGPAAFSNDMLRLNEVSIGGPFDFIELYNNSPYSIRFPEGWSIVEGFGPDDGGVLSIPKGTRFTAGGCILCIPSQDTVPPGLPEGTLVITADTGKEFRLSRNSFIRLLFEGLDEPIDFLARSGTAASWGLLPDGASVVSGLIPTPGRSNMQRFALPRVPELRINEIQTREEGDYLFDFIELKNTGDDDISVRSGEWVLRDENDDSGIAIPRGTVIPAGGLLLVLPKEWDASVFPNFPEAVTAPDEGDTFGLGTEDQVRLYYRGKLQDKCFWHGGHLYSAGYAELEDGTERWVDNLQPTPGEENAWRSPRFTISIE